VSSGTIMVAVLSALRWFGHHCLHGLFAGLDCGPDLHKRLDASNLKRRHHLLGRQLRIAVGGD
jgi:hypothetical protein